MLGHLLVIAVVAGGIHFIFDVPPIDATILGFLTLIVFMLMEQE